MTVNPHKFPWAYEHLQEEWFKRCMEDFPQHPVIGRGDPWTWQEYNVWFKKWFGQFKEETR